MNFLVPSNRKFPGYLLFATTLCICISACTTKKPSSSQNPNVPQGNGIIEGKEVRRTEAVSRFVVALVGHSPEGQSICTGTLIGEHLVLTAAHCVEPDIEQMTVVFSTAIRNVSQSLMREVDGVKQNPRWKKPNQKGNGDLALVHFVGDLPEGYTTVQLADEEFNLEPGQSVIFAGYGVANADARLGSGVLRETVTKVLNPLSPTEWLTDGRESGVCYGDSGGPALVRIATASSKSQSEYLQWGVASSVTSESCDASSVHTAIMSYRSWLSSASVKLEAAAQRASSKKSVKKISSPK